MDGEEEEGEVEECFKENWKRQEFLDMSRGWSSGRLVKAGSTEDCVGEEGVTRGEKEEGVESRVTATVLGVEGGTGL